MKKLLILILIIIPNLGKSQTNQPPTCYLNSQLISLDSVFILAKSIENIHLDKSTANGSIYFTTKEKPWKYRKLEELLKTTSLYSQIFDKSIIPVFLIDGKLINNRSDVKIDLSYYCKVTLRSLSNVSGLEGNCRKIVIIDINLTDTDPKKEIRIRGNSIQEIADSINRKK